MNAWHATHPGHGSSWNLSQGAVGRWQMRLTAWVRSSGGGGSSSWAVGPAVMRLGLPVWPGPRQSWPAFRRGYLGLGALRQALTGTVSGVLCNCSLGASCGRGDRNFVSSMRQRPAKHETRCIIILLHSNAAGQHTQAIALAPSHREASRCTRCTVSHHSTPVMVMRQCFL